MAFEIEIKVRCQESAFETRRKLERFGYQIIEPRTLESDRVFDRSNQELKQADQLLRLRSAGSKATVTYKGPGVRARHKTREEIEFDVSNRDHFLAVLDRLGYLQYFRYEKYRTKFAIVGELGIVTLDETPIGVFLELEGPPEWIDETAARIGLSPSEYLTASYGALYQEYRRLNPIAPADMIFEEPEKKEP